MYRGVHGSFIDAALASYYTCLSQTNDCFDDPWRVKVVLYNVLYTFVREFVRDALDTTKENHEGTAVMTLTTFCENVGARCFFVIAAVGEYYIISEDATRAVRALEVGIVCLSSWMGYDRPDRNQWALVLFSICSLWPVWFAQANL